MPLRRQPIVTLLLGMILTSSLWGCASGSAGSSWQVLSEADFGQPTLSTMFLDAAFGVTTDLGGGIHYTEDSGMSWTRAGVAGRSRVALEIVDADLIWHIGYGGAVHRSTDRARTWEYLSSLPHTGHIEYVSFADAAYGWAVSTEMDEIFTTDDGARTWKRLPFPEGMLRPAALHLQTSRTGLLLDVAGNLFISRNGGETWEQRSLSLEDDWTIPDLNHSAALRFSDDDHGLVAVSLLAEGQTRTLVLRTADGGLTWTEESLPVPAGMFHLSRDGVYLTHVDLRDHGQITLLRAP
ncbi:MAG: hypothetical protein JXB85_15000 [Anaerolineales bacterium]|nr:hypothetical protein [Anaerolineales bacterium]